MAPGFLQLPEALARRPDLTAASKVVFAFLRDREARGLAVPGVRGIAAACGLATNSARRALQELSRAGLLAIEHAPGRRAHYCVRIDCASRSEAPQDLTRAVSNSDTEAPQNLTRPITDQTNIQTKKRARKPDPLTWSPDAGWRGVSEADRDSWRAAYPSVDLNREFAAMAAWLGANPLKARKRSWRRFITNWLNRAQDRAANGRRERPRLCEHVVPEVLNG